MSLRSTLFAAACCVFAPVAHAASIDLNLGDDWTEFRFHINYKGGAWLETNDNLGVLQFNVNLTEAAYLQVTDGWRDGDVFEVYSNGTSLGSTSAAQATGADILGDFTGAFNDPRWSSGQWLLEAGQYTITGFITQMPEEKGRGALRLVDIPKTPLPAGMVLLLTGGAGFAAMSARRKKAVKGGTV